jgi:hypothetical protein
LFTTIGNVKRAEIQYEGNGRSKGSGVVEMEGPELAEQAIGKFLSHLVLILANFVVAKFTGYQYGGRPLGLAFVRYTNLSNGDHMDTDATGGLTQDQIM